MNHARCEEPKVPELVGRSPGPRVGDGPDTGGVIAAMTRLTRPINYLGLPVLVVPAGRAPLGLPVGLQLIGRPFGDETLVALGSAFQAKTEHHLPVPTLS